MSSKPQSLQHLETLINQTNQNFEIIKNMMLKKEKVDSQILTTTHDYLQEIIQHAVICELNKMADLAGALEEILNQFIQKKILLDVIIVETIEHASTLLFSIMRHGEENLKAVINQTLNALYLIYHQSNKTPYTITHESSYDTSIKPKNLTIQTIIKPSTLGITKRDMIQLNNIECVILTSLYEEYKPIISYKIQVTYDSIEKTVTTIKQKIMKQYELITLLATQAQHAEKQAAFAFVFTCSQSYQKVINNFTTPGIIHWIKKDEQPKTTSIQQGNNHE